MIRQSATGRFHAGVLAVPAGQLAMGTILVEQGRPSPAGVGICARVSSGDQRGDLDRQVARLTAVATELGLAPTRVVAEVGSGLNGHRAKLTSLGARLYRRRSARRRAQAAPVATLSEAVA